MQFLVMRMSQAVFAAAEGVAIYNERFWDALYAAT